MGLLNTVKTALAANPVRTAISKMRAASGGHLYSDQAVSKYNSFFDELMRTDTDEVLAKVGMQRHQLSALLYDDEIDEKIERRIESLTQANYTLSPSEGDNALFIYDQLNKHLESLLLACMDARLYGYSVPEIIWDQQTYKNTGKIQPLRLTAKPIEWFEPKSDGRLFYFAPHLAMPVEVDTKYKFMLIQHRPTFTNPKGKALLSRVYWLWFFKKNGWQFWSKFLERFGSPLLLGTTDGDTQQMASALSAAHNQSIFTMPENDKVSAISASGNGEAFKAYDDAINRRIAKYLLGQTLTSGTDRGGTAGQGLIHEKQQEIIFNSDKAFATRYVRQFITTICELNGIADVPWFNFKPEKGIQDELADRDVKLTNQGVVFTREYYEDTYDIEAKYIDNVGTPKTLPKVSSAPLAKVFTDNGLAINEDGYLDVTDKSAMAALATRLGMPSKFALDDGDSEIFTPEQQELENLSNGLLASNKQPLDSKSMLDVIKTAIDEDDLRDKLFALVGDDLSDSEFTEQLAVALQVADIHGMVDETVGK